MRPDLSELHADPHARAELMDGSAMAELELRMRAEFTPPVPLPVVHRCVEEAVASFEGARIQTYLPLLVERRTRRVLHELARRPAATPGPPTR